jgi:hypothetical protein
MKKTIRVVDIPSGVNAEQAEQLLNEPIADGYMLMTLRSLGVSSGAERAYFKLRVKPSKLSDEE